LKYFAAQGTPFVMVDGKFHFLQVELEIGQSLFFRTPPHFILPEPGVFELCPAKT
jgi:hypothetical protein